MRDSSTCREGKESLWSCKNNFIVHLQLVELGPPPLPKHLRNPRHCHSSPVYFAQVNNFHDLATKLADNNGPETCMPPATGLIDKLRAAGKWLRVGRRRPARANGDATPGVFQGFSHRKMAL